MKAIKYLLLIMLCFYGEQIYSQKKAVWVPDSIASQISVIQNQAREWKQHTDEKHGCAMYERSKHSNRLLPAIASKRKSMK